MSLDGAFLHVVKTELLQKQLIGARVDKIHQPAREEIVISFRAQGGTLRLALSANPATARVCLTEQTPDNPKSPPMFCMLLRKYIGNGRLTAIEQDGLERILTLDFLCMNEIGDMATYRLVIEIMGRSSNIILLTEAEGKLRVIDSIKRVTDEISSVRRILPGISYQTPPREERLLLLNYEKPAVEAALHAHSGERLTKALLRLFEGVSPILARECAYYCAHDLDVTIEELLADSTRLGRFHFFWSKVTDALQNDPQPTVICEKDGKPKDFSFIAIEQYGAEMLVRREPSANRLLDRYFQTRTTADRMKQRSGDLLRMLLSTYERVARRTEVQKLERENCKERETFRVYGDLLTANLFQLEKGQTRFAATHFETGEAVNIPLDARLSPQQNAQKYYAEYKKLGTAEAMLTKRIAEGEQELLYIDSVFDAASRAETEAELTEIKQELMETGYLKSAKAIGKKNKQPKPLPPMQFTAEDGTKILVGRNNLQNDKLTLRTAHARDIWLHTKNIPGSHVIICCQGQPVQEKTLVTAAEIAAYCSKAQSSNQVPVDYTEVRYVKKPNGAKPGMVIFTHNKTVYVQGKLPETHAQAALN